MGDVRPLTTAVPLGGARMMDDCQLHADSKDNVLSVGAWAPMDRPGMCCAWLDDFDGVVPPYEPDMVLPGRDMDVGITDHWLGVNRTCTCLSGMWRWILWISDEISEI